MRAESTNIGSLNACVSGKTNSTTLSIRISVPAGKPRSAREPAASWEPFDPSVARSNSRSALAPSLASLRPHDFNRTRNVPQYRRCHIAQQKSREGRSPVRTDHHEVGARAFSTIQDDRLGIAGCHDTSAVPAACPQPLNTPLLHGLIRARLASSATSEVVHPFKRRTRWPRPGDDLFECDLACRRRVHR